MTLKLITALITFTLISCGKRGTFKKDQTSFKDSVEQTDKTVYEFEWYKRIEEYNGKYISVKGYMLFDTIINTLKDQNYVLYERPNCYDCEEIKVSPLSDLKIEDIDDTTFSNPAGTGRQWRNVKLTGLVENHTYLRINKIKRSEYSYPPDEYYNSFNQISEDMFRHPKAYDTMVKSEGYILVNIITFPDEYMGFDFKNSDAKDVTVYIKKGYGANEVEPLKNKYTQADLKVRDKNGNLIKGKKVRIYGSWSDVHDPNNPDKESSRMIYAEIIEILK